MVPIRESGVRPVARSHRPGADPVFHFAGRGTVVALLAGLLLLLVPLVWWLQKPSPSVPSVGTSQAAALAARPSGSSTGSAPALGPASAPTAPLRGKIPLQDGNPVVRAQVIPVTIDLPSLGVRAHVVPVGLDHDDALAVPDDVATVGWYRFGSDLGSAAGSTVIAGHVDSASQGAGAFFNLRRLQPGDVVVVTGSQGATRRYQVVAREEWPKSEVPMGRIFSTSGAPRLTLVTCGGGFNRARRSYRDNVAVTAVEVS